MFEITLLIHRQGFAGGVGEKWGVGGWVGIELTAFNTCLLIGRMGELCSVFVMLKVTYHHIADASSCSNVHSLAESIYNVSIILIYADLVEFQLPFGITNRHC